jgi:hypothetical protein
VGRPGARAPSAPPAAQAERIAAVGIPTSLTTGKRPKQ